jgi:hypothetical protein
MGSSQPTPQAQPGINLGKKHSPNWKGKAAPNMVYVQLGILGGHQHYLACWKPTAVHFGLTFEEHYFETTNKHGDKVRVRPNLHRKIKLPKAGNATYAKNGHSNKHSYYSIRVSSRLKLDNLAEMLHKIITKNKPDYLVNHTGSRVYLSRAVKKTK